MQTNSRPYLQVERAGKQKPKVLLEFCEECKFFVRKKISFQLVGKRRDELILVIYNEAQQDVIFSTLIEQTGHPDDWIWHSAMGSLIHKLEMLTTRQSYPSEEPIGPVELRTQKVLDAIAQQVQTQPMLFEKFCSRFQFRADESPFDYLVKNWLEQLAQNPALEYPTPEAILAAQLFFGVYDTTWSAVGEMLLKLLDHADLNLRACAAYQIGTFCYKQSRSPDAATPETQGMPPLETVWDLIRDREIQRPGVAGAFWKGAPIYDSPLDVGEWLLDVLERSPHPEPYIPYFPCNLAFEAHERFCNAPAAIRRLRKIGRADVAIEAAVERTPDPDPDQGTVLTELGQDEDPEQIRIAAWGLAYKHRQLHLKGAEQGYVEQIEHAEFELFLLYSRDVSAEQESPEPEAPYAVVLYPKPADHTMPFSTAQQWADRLFPRSVRGLQGPDHCLQLDYYHRHRDIRYRYQRGYIEYCVLPSKHNAPWLRLPPRRITQIVIGYRSKRPWNPKALLEDEFV